MPEPPACLTPAQSEIWRTIVATKPVDWFQGDSIPVLIGYVRAIDLDNEIAAAVNGFDRTDIVGEGFRNWKSLVKMQLDQQAHVAMLATKLRLTPQSRYTPKAASTANNRAGLARPWGAVIAHEGTGNG